ncbi:MAG TPA: response regulator [Polyangiaceae bacterium]|nr:response regulator [Polyangiaceae bacterium]
MKNLLIVDDSKAMRMVVRRALRQTQVGDYEIDEATNGQEALNKLRGAHFDVVLADWNMPEMNGIELLRAVRSEHMPVRFGFITSEGTEDIRNLALETGAQFVIVKPFTPETLNAALAPAE